MIAVQAGGVSWVHQDPVTKSQRVTDNGTDPLCITQGEVDKIDPSGDCSGGGGGQPRPPHQQRRQCPVTPLSEITDPDAQRFEQANGNQIDTAHLTQETQNALTCLENHVRDVGGTFTLNSAYRPPAYQRHL